MFVSRKIGFDTAKGEPSSLGGGTSGPVRRQGAAHARACLRHAAADRAQDLYALRVAAHDDVEFHSNFLDTLEADVPTGCWVMRVDPAQLRTRMKNIE